jgi:hypothetical protein
MSSEKCVLALYAPTVESRSNADMLIEPQTGLKLVQTTTGLCVNAQTQ